MAITPRRASSNITTTLEYLLGGQDRLGHTPGPMRRTNIVQQTPVPQNKELIIKAESMGTSLYQLTMVIHGVEYSDKLSPKFPLTVSLGQGNYRFCSQIPVNGTKVQCRCSCPDFYFTWWYWDNKNKALAGPAMRPYVRKTASWPVRNPLSTPGVCKHLKSLTKKLIDLRILRR
jgi:hypothetical protein